MQTIPNNPNVVTPNPGQTQNPGGNPAGGDGFAKIPTRIKDLAPLVVEDTSSEVRAQIIDGLQELNSHVAVVHRNAAEAYISQNHYENALPHLEAAATFAPDVMEFRNQLGFVQFINGQDDAAIQSFQVVLAQNPQQPDALFNLGMVLFGRSEFVQAEECFRRSLEIDPNDAETWNNRGACLFQSGRASDAEVCFRRALEIDPNNEDAKINLATI
ncbi:MAG: tetratricopeptide repeat protein [Planctomycetota bacterium]|jgi:Flp pilus assembly protein TadD